MLTYEYTESHREESERSLEDDGVEDDAEDGGGEADHDEVPDRHHGHCHHHPEGDGGCQEAMETYQGVLLHSAVL